MSYKTVEAYVEVEVDLDDWKDQELIDEMKSRGYTCVKDYNQIFETSDWQMLLDIIDKQPRNWGTDQLREKVFNERNKIEQT
jgi:hypothetical protein